MRQETEMLFRVPVIALLVIALLAVVLPGCANGSGSGQASTQKVDTSKIISTYYSSNKPAKAGLASTTWLYYSQVSVQGTSGKVYQSDTCLNEVYATSPASRSAVYVGCLYAFLDASGKPVVYDAKIYGPESTNASMEIAIERFSTIPGAKASIHSYVYFVQYADGSTWGYNGLESNLDASQLEELISRGVLYDLGTSKVTKVG